MARTKPAVSLPTADKSAPWIPVRDIDIEEAFGLPSSGRRRQVGKHKHVGFTSITFLPGRIEASYVVQGGRITREGTMTIRISSDEPLGVIGQQLSQTLAEEFRKLEKAS